MFRYLFDRKLKLVHNLFIKNHQHLNDLSGKIKKETKNINFLLADTSVNLSTPSLTRIKGGYEEVYKYIVGKSDTLQ